MLVHASKLKFIVKVRAGAQTTHHHLGTLLLHKVTHQTIKALDAHIGHIAEHRPRHGHALFEREHGLLVVRHGHPDHHLTKQLTRPANHVFMPQRDGVKRAGIHGNYVLSHSDLHVVCIAMRAIMPVLDLGQKNSFQRACSKRWKLSIPRFSPQSARFFSKCACTLPAFR